MTTKTDRKAAAKGQQADEKEMTASQFEALPDAEKDRIWEEIDRSVRGKTARQLRAMSRPLTKAERARWEQIKNKGGQPKVGQGAKVIALSVERGLLERADAYAKAGRLNRAQLVAKGLELAMGSKKPSRQATK